MASKTNLRVAELIRQRAAHVILFELKDPRMGFVTITRAKLSADFATATIYWSVLGGDAERSKTSHALEHARIFVQRRVAEGLRTRVAPEVVFAYDESVEGSIRMGSLLKQLRSERGDEPAGAATPAAEQGAPDAASEADTEDEPEDGPEDGDQEPDDEEPDEDEPDDEEPGDAPPRDSESRGS